MHLRKENPNGKLDHGFENSAGPPGLTNKSPKPFHLLGLSDSGIIELSRLNNYSLVRSCDTSSAYVHGIKGIDFSKNPNFIASQKRINFYDQFRKNKLEVIKKNVYILNQSGKGKLHLPK